jgi:hypothetical protein
VKVVVKKAVVFEDTPANPVAQDPSKGKSVVI